MISEHNWHYTTLGERYTAGTYLPDRLLAQILHTRRANLMCARFKSNKYTTGLVYKADEALLCGTMGLQQRPSVQVLLHNSHNFYIRTGMYSESSLAPRRYIGPACTEAVGN